VGGRIGPTVLKVLAAITSDSILIGFVDAEFPHAGAEGAGVHPEHVGRAMRALDAPASIFENANNMIALDFLERPGDRRRSVAVAGLQLFPDSQDGPM